MKWKECTDDKWRRHTINLSNFLSIGCICSIFFKGRGQYANRRVSVFRRPADSDISKAQRAARHTPTLEDAKCRRTFSYASMAWITSRRFWVTKRHGMSFSKLNGMPGSSLWRSQRPRSFSLPVRYRLRMSDLRRIVSSYNRFASIVPSSWFFFCSRSIVIRLLSMFTMNKHEIKVPTTIFTNRI